MKWQQPQCCHLQTSLEIASPQSSENLPSLASDHCPSGSATTTSRLRSKPASRQTTASPSRSSSMPVRSAVQENANAASAGMHRHYRMTQLPTEMCSDAGWAHHVYLAFFPRLYLPKSSCTRSSSLRAGSSRNAILCWSREEQRPWRRNHECIELDHHGSRLRRFARQSAGGLCSRS